MDKWHTLLASEQLAPGQVIEISWQQQDLLVYRTQDGECLALSGYCPHMKNYIPNGLAPHQNLSDLLKGSELRCPYHDWRFDGQGKCTHIPNGQRVPLAVKRGLSIMPHWRLREIDQKIQIRETPS